MSTGIDRAYVRLSKCQYIPQTRLCIPETYKAEIPLQVGISKRGYKTSGGAVYVDIHRKSFLFVLFAEEPVDFLDVLVFTSVGRPENGTDEDSVLINYWR